MKDYDEIQRCEVLLRGMYSNKYGARIAKFGETFEPITFQECSLTNDTLEMLERNKEYLALDTIEKQNLHMAVLKRRLDSV
jgi:hypothetical protein